MYMYMYKQTAVRYFFKIISKNEDKALFFWVKLCPGTLHGAT